MGKPVIPAWNSLIKPPGRNGLLIPLWNTNYTLPIVTRGLNGLCQEEQKCRNTVAQYNRHFWRGAKTNFEFFTRGFRKSRAQPSLPTLEIIQFRSPQPQGFESWWVHICIFHHFPARGQVVRRWPEGTEALPFNAHHYAGSKHSRNQNEVHPNGKCVCVQVLKSNKRNHNTQ